MKSKQIIFGIIIIALTLSFVNASIAKEKIDEQVYEALEESELVTVVIKLEEERSSHLDKSNKEKVEQTLEEEPITQYQDLIVADVTQKEISDLKNSEAVERVEYSPMFKASLQDSTIVVNATTVWPIQINNINITGIDQTICVLDTGVDFSHPALQGKNLTCIIDCFDKSCVENCSLSDDNGHGTHVAGIISAATSISGVATGAKIIGLKVLDENGDSSASGTTDIKRAIDWCVTNRIAYNISVISMSLGTINLYDSYCDSSFSSTLTKGINNATVFNISVVASTGNSGSGVPRNTTHISSPACIQNTSAVSATNKDDSIASYGHYNNITDFFAPGTSINSTHLSNSFVIFSGTSMAAPHISGAIALVRQFYSLTNNKVYTPLEIQTVLKNNGKNISTSTANITRINIHDAIISLDTTSPSVTLISPVNNHLNLTNNQTFSCNATDTELKNVTFSLWNSSSGIVNQSSQTFSTTFYEFNTTITDISEGTYSWNCNYFDQNGNSAPAASNFSLTIGGLLTNLITPPQNNFTNINTTDFTCQSQSESSFSLTSTTFSLWNSTSLIFDSTKNVSGTINSTSFNFTFNYEDNYKWNCLALNNNTNSTTAGENFTISYDTSKPNITLKSPPGGHSVEGTTTFNFAFNVTDNLNISQCNLMFGGSSVAQNDSITLSINSSISHSVSLGTYSWSINCTDAASNIGNSITRTLTITSSSSGSSDSGGGGGGGGGGSGSSIPPSSNQSSSSNSNTEDETQIFEEKKTIPDTQEEESKRAPMTGSATQEPSGEPFFDKWTVAFTLIIVVFFSIFLKYYLFKRKPKEISQEEE